MNARMRARERERVRESERGDEEEKDRMYQNEDAICNALERTAVVSRNGVFRNLVYTPCTTIEIEICPLSVHDGNSRGA